MDETSNSLAEFLTEPAFRAAVKRAKVDWLSYDAFLELRLPATLSPRETWDVLQSMRRAQAIQFPGSAALGTPAWYTPTYRMLEMLSEIDRSCSVESRMAGELFDANSWGRTARVSARVSEVAAAARLDGFEISDQTVLLSLAPRTAGEKLARNAQNLTAELGALSTRPFTMELLMELRDAYVCGISEAGLEEARANCSSVLGLAPHDQAIYRRDDELASKVDALMAYANCEVGEPYEHHAIRAIAVCNAVRALRPLPDCNHLVARTIFELYCRKHGLPVLGILPIVTGTLRELQAAGNLLDRQLTMRMGRDTDAEEYDVTGALTAAIQVCVGELRRMQAATARVQTQDRELLARLADDQRFNRRQRLLLGRALASPEWTFTVAGHQNVHGVTYATARKDLVLLAQGGYLEVGTQGRAHVYVPAPGLPAKLGMEVGAE